METIIFSTICCFSAVISLHCLHLHGTFPSDMLSFYWAASGVPPLYRTAASCWILTGAERSFIPPSNCPYSLTVPRKVGAVGPEPYNADTAKVRHASSRGSQSISILCLYRVVLLVWRRVRAYFSSYPGFFLSITLKALLLLTDDGKVLNLAFNTLRARAD